MMRSLDAAADEDRSYVMAFAHEISTSQFEAVFQKRWLHLTPGTLVPGPDSFTQVGCTLSHEFYRAATGVRLVHVKQV